MQTNPYPDPNLYSNIRDETACINKYSPVRKLPQQLINTQETKSPLLKMLSLCLFSLGKRHSD